MVLSANNNHIEEDLLEACRLRRSWPSSGLAFSGSFSHDPIANQAWLCEKQPNLAFFQAFIVMVR